MPARRFPPWSVEDNGAFIVRDHGGKLAYIYYEEEPVAGTKDTTKKYRFNSRCEAFLAYTEPGWTCSLGVPQRDAAIKQ
jgi:hypothetical protein